jgi:hypothetical protein
MSLQSKIYEIAEKTCTTTDLKITQPTSSAVIIINLLSFTNPKDAQRERERERGASLCVFCNTVIIVDKQKVRLYILQSTCFNAITS